MATQICVNLPNDVEDPKFKMFDRVQVDKPQFEDMEGVIVGMRYCCPLNAIAENVGYGWTYSVSFLFGLTPHKAAEIERKGQEIADYVDEDDLVLVSAPPLSIAA